MLLILRGCKNTLETVFWLGMNCCVNKLVPVHSGLDQNKGTAALVAHFPVPNKPHSVDVKHHVYVMFGVALIVSDATASCIRGSDIASVCVVDGDKAGCISLSASIRSQGLCESRGGCLCGRKVALNVNAQCARSNVSMFCCRCEFQTNEPYSSSRYTKTKHVLCLQEEWQWVA